MGENVQQGRTRVYLSSERACIDFAKMYLEEGFAVRVGKERDANRNRNRFFFEYWKEA
ncbi:MAG: hypothetical protein NC311_18955 [Muribaculaceae bacterium]|nr:hypothetical protein [Muribaculaceae bacterium]